VRDVLRRLVAGDLTEDEALAELRRMQLDELGGRARLDLGRYLRRGIPEVVLATGKAPHDAARLTVAAAEAASMDVVVYHTSARVLRPGFLPEASDGKVAILTAGTSDLPAADEARMVIESCGVEARLEADLGVAGLHRFVGPLAAALEWGADVIIVAAGMDGVLPGLVAGLIDLPVIGLPVSTGYGHGAAGEGALTTMLQSCSTGLTVVNIDSGVGAGAAAVLIAARAGQGRRRGTTTATMATTTAATSIKPNRAAATPRETSAPPGSAKTSPKRSIAARTATSSHGKPRRRRP